MKKKLKAFVFVINFTYKKKRRSFPSTTTSLSTIVLFHAPYKKRIDARMRNWNSRINVGRGSGHMVDEKLLHR